MAAQAWLIRHGETEWSATGRHTGRTDIPLTDAGRAAAQRLSAYLDGHPFRAVLTSPLRRARDTCALAGLGEGATTVDDLREWDYGDYEGLTTAQIRTERAGWSMWRDGCPRGESAAAVGARADHVVELLHGAQGDVAVFGHGHMLRVLAARWLDQPPEDGSLYRLDPAGVSVLGWEREQPVLQLWNRPA